MNMRSKIATLAVAFMALFACKAEGQVELSVSVPAGFPNGLPMYQTMAQLYDGMVEQNVYSDMRFYYTAKDGTTWSFQPGLLYQTNFVSYAAYKTAFVNTMLGYMNAALATNANPNGPVTVFAGLSISGAPYELSLIEYSNSSMSNVTSNWLAGLDALDVNLQVPVPGLRTFTIQVNGLYTNIWNGTSWSLTSSPYPVEKTGVFFGTAWLVLNPWYCIATNEARFYVTIGSVTQQYTQIGAPLLPAMLTITDPMHIQLAMTPGSDTTVQYRDDFASGSWQTLWSTTWSTNNGTVSIAMTVQPPPPQQPPIANITVAPSPHRYFRAFSH